MFGSKGKIDIAIQKTSYAPGDTISGNVVLTLKKPVKAKELSISLIGTGKYPPLGNHGTIVGDTSRHRIYGFKLPLDSEREYSQGREYRFEIKIPADLLRKPLRAKWSRSWVDGKEVVPSHQMQWYLLAKLDIPFIPHIPLGLGISKKVDITIG
jgi:hypothetical protein